MKASLKQELVPRCVQGGERSYPGQGAQNVNINKALLFSIRMTGHSLPFISLGKKMAKIRMLVCQQSPSLGFLASRQSWLAFFPVV